MYIRVLISMNLRWIPEMDSFYKCCSQNPCVLSFRVMRRKRRRKRNKKSFKSPPHLQYQLKIATKHGNIGIFIKFYSQLFSLPFWTEKISSSISCRLTKADCFLFKIAWIISENFSCSEPQSESNSHHT